MPLSCFYGTLYNFQATESLEAKTILGGTVTTGEGMVTCHDY